MITKEDIQRVANKYLDTNNLFTIIAEPVEKNIKLTLSKKVLEKAACLAKWQNNR
jgi:hypothetical protein